MYSDFIPRELEQRIRQVSANFPAIALAGPRQVGKTSLLRKIFPDYRYVTLDRILSAEQAESDPEGFLRQNPAPIIIDEIQYAPNLLRFLKIEIDQNRELSGRYILTGSQRLTVMQGVSESLAGRIALLDLEGLSCKELEIVQEDVWSDDNLSKLLVFGGFPELWTGRQEGTEDVFLHSYIGTYLERDVKQIVNIGNLRDFNRFLRACALRSGQLLNKSDLSRDVGVSVPTITEWLSVLEVLGHVILVEPWFGNIGKRIVKSPKLYLADTGLLCALAGITLRNLWSSNMIGAVWETFVLSEMRKQASWYPNAPTIWHYRDQSNYEVDFICERGDVLDLYECKWTASPSKQQAAVLNKVAAVFENAPTAYKIRRQVLVSRSRARVSMGALDFCSPLEGLLE